LIFPKYLYSWRTWHVERKKAQGESCLQKGELIMVFENANKMVKVAVRRMFFLVALSVIGAVLLPAAAWAQQEKSPDKGITSERPDTRVQLQAPATALAEGPACDGANFATNAFNNNIFMGGPMVAIAWTPSATETISRIEVFTGESAGPDALAIWSDDGGSPSKPLANLSNTNNFSLSAANSWQGADLLSPVTVNAGTKYWIVFDPVGGEQAPVQNGVGQQYWGSFAGTVTGVPAPSWFGPFSSADHAWKFRVFCLPPVKDVYAVKFLCGSFTPPFPSEQDWPVKPGNYFTAINVHNPNSVLVSFQKKAVLLYGGEQQPRPEEPMPPGKLFDAALKDDWGLEIDCSDIRKQLLGSAAPNAPAFITGWVVIEVSGTSKHPEPRPIDVTAVYTSHGWDLSTKTPTYVGFAEDVVPVLPKRVKP
jgi:hypothetical protein